MPTGGLLCAETSDYGPPASTLAIPVRIIPSGRRPHRCAQPSRQEWRAPYRTIERSVVVSDAGSDAGITVRRSTRCPCKNKGRTRPGSRKPPCCSPWLSDKPTASPTIVRLTQGHDSELNHFGRGGPALATSDVLTTSAKTAIVRFVQAAWFVRQPPPNSRPNGANWKPRRRLRLT